MQLVKSEIRERGEPNFEQLSFGSELETWSLYYSVNERETLTSPLEEQYYILLC